MQFCTVARSSTRLFARSYGRLFACSANPFACSALLSSLLRFTALSRLLARSSAFDFLPYFQGHPNHSARLTHTTRLIGP